MNVSSSELAKIKRPDKYELTDTSPIVMQAWEWFQRTPMEEITRLTGVPERDILVLF